VQETTPARRFVLCILPEVFVIVKSLSAEMRLLASTGVDQVDQILRGFVDLLELSFPNRVRACYATGSYADAGATPLSDIDVTVVFKDSFEDAEYERFRRIVSVCKPMIPYGFDVGAISEAELLRAAAPDPQQDWLIVLTAVSLKRASLLLYGEDIRDTIALPSQELFTRCIMPFPVLVMVGQRGHPERLRVPVDYPDPADEFYGYTRRPLRGRDSALHPSTKRLLHATSAVTLVLVTYQAGQIVGSKREALALYCAQIAGEWAPFLAEVDQICRVQWGYRVPDAPDDRAWLRHLCERGLAFENYFLGIYHDYLVSESRHPDAMIRDIAMQRLEKVMYTH
jgi:hypothetical protein